MQWSVTGTSGASSGQSGRCHGQFSAQGRVVHRSATHEIGIDTTRHNTTILHRRLSRHTRAGSLERKKKALPLNHIV